MRKRINNFLNVLIGISVGTLVGHSVYIIYDYKAHPGMCNAVGTLVYQYSDVWNILCGCCGYCGYSEDNYSPKVG